MLEHKREYGDLLGSAGAAEDDLRKPEWGRSREARTD
jgi:hypothetical protein